MKLRLSNAERFFLCRLLSQGYSHTQYSRILLGCHRQIQSPQQQGVAFLCPSPAVLYISRETQCPILFHHMCGAALRGAEKSGKAETGMTPPSRVSFWLQTSQPKRIPMRQL